MTKPIMVVNSGDSRSEEQGGPVFKIKINQQNDKE